MKSFSMMKEEIINTASGGSSTNGSHKGGIAGLGSPPDDFPPVKKKKKLDGRTKEFKEKVKALELSRQKRHIKELEKKYQIKLGR